MQFGLKQATIRRIQQVLASHSQVEEAVLYGSRAKGNYKPGSDIDLTLKGADLNANIICSIEHQLDELMLPYTFDLSIFHQIDNPDLREHIERVGQEFFSISQTA